MTMRVCAEHGCAQLVQRGRCAQHQKLFEQRDRDRRGNTAMRGYGRAWQIEREIYLKRHPFCEAAVHAGQRIKGEIVDHVTAINDGGQRLGARKQTLCRSCHAVKTHAEVRARHGLASP